MPPLPTSFFEAEEWIKENCPRYKILDWNLKTSQKSKFLDLKNNREFYISFQRFKEIIKRRPEVEFTLTKEERSRKRTSSLKETMIKKYGVENPSYIPEFRRKAEDTLFKKIGYKNVSQSPEVKEKKKNKCLNDTGFEYRFQIPENREKSKIALRDENTIKKRSSTIKSIWNVENISQAEDIINKKRETKIKNGHIHLINGKTIKELSHEKKCAYTTLQSLYLKTKNEDLIEQFTLKKSSLEQIVENKLIDIGVDYISNRKLENTNFKPDFLIEKHKLIIECDGLYWHSDIRNDDKNYHKEKLKIYNDFGYSALFFRENEILETPDIVKSIILNKLNLNRKIWARKTQLRNDINCRNFLNENHLMGDGAGRYYSLVLDDEVVAAIQVKWKQKKIGLLEVSRFCTKNGISVVGGFSKLIKEVIKSEQPKRIMTFIDKRYGSGKYLDTLGWKYINEFISFCWTDFEKTFHRMNFKSNSGYEQGLFKLWDCGQARWDLIL